MHLLDSPSAPSDCDNPSVDLEIDARRRLLFRVALLSLGPAPWLAGCSSTDEELLLDSAPDSGTSAAPPTPAPLPPAADPPLTTPPPPAALPAGTLPSWVPAAGEVAVLTQANGGLSNTFRSQAAAYFEEFYFVKTVNDYSGAFKNPYWGMWGACVFFGGGHAGTNDNTVTIAEYGTSAITFRRVVDPTPWFGTGTDATTKYNNSAGNANAALNREYMEALVDGKPGSPHSYGSGDIVGPEHGGAANGTFLRVISAAVNVHNDAGAIAAHQVHFNDTQTPSNSRRWERVTNLAFAPSMHWAAPNWTAFVPRQQRVYIVTRNSSSLRWFDRSMRQWVTGAGTGFDTGSDSHDNGAFFYVPSRDLLVYMDRRLGSLRVQWMDVSAAQPTRGGMATLSNTLALPAAWTCACWCPDNDRIIVGGVQGEAASVHEIEIPAAPGGIWNVARAPFGANQTIAWGEVTAGIGVSYGKWAYDSKARAIVYMPFAASSGDDTVWVYRPRGT